MKKKKLIKRAEKEEKSERIVLLKDNIDNILLDYDEMNSTAKGEDILKKLANDERMINYKNLFFKTGNPAIGNYDFLKRFGTLYGLFHDLISETISVKKAAIEQNQMIKKIEELKNFVLSETNTNSAIKKSKTKTPRKRILTTQKSVLNNALKLYDTSTAMINAFINKNIYPGNLEKDVCQDEELKYDERIAERTESRRQYQETKGY